MNKVNFNSTDSIWIKVPKQTILTVQGLSSGTTKGDIIISNLSDLVEVSNYIGGIKLDNINGPIAASTILGNIDVTLKQLVKGPLVFTATAGHIDIALPEKTTANIDILSINGELFASPSFHITPILITEEDETKDTISIAEGNPVFLRNFKNRLHTFASHRNRIRTARSVPNQIKGKINGGGDDIILRTTQGKIYLRTTEKQ